MSSAMPTQLIAALQPALLSLAQLGANEHDPLFSEWVRIIITSLFINLCFFVAELMSYQRFLFHDNRSTVEACSHLMLGPAIFISFLSGPSFMGTFVFFACLWNFLTLSGRGRPSFVVAHPFHKGVTKLELCWWLEALLVLIHHCYLGGSKLAFDAGVIRIGPRTLSADLIVFWIAGSSGIHVAHGMRHAGIHGADMVMYATFLLRTISSVLLIVYTSYAEVRALMIGDLCWVSVTIILRYVVWPKPTPVKPPTANDDPEAPPVDKEPSLTHEQLVEQTIMRRVLTLTSAPVKSRPTNLPAVKVHWSKAKAAAVMSAAAAASARQSTNDRETSCSTQSSARPSFHGEI